jgi:hypothetical protein
MASRGGEMRVLLQLNLEFSAYDTYDRVALYVARSDVAEWTLALCLLVRKLIDEIAVSSDGRVLSLRWDEGLMPNLRAKFGWNEATDLVVWISTTELEYWEGFFLKLWRDGAAPVDHLDLEIDGRLGGEGRALDLVLKVADAVEGVVGDQALRRLGLAEDPQAPDAREESDHRK